MKLHTSLLASAACLVATGAFAETNYLAGSLSYGQIDYSGSPTTIDGVAVSGAYEGSTGAFTYGVDASYDKYSIGSGTDIDFNSFSLQLGYDISPALTVVALAETSDIYFTDITTYALGVEYAYNNYTFGIGGAQIDFDDTTDETVYAFAEYDNGSYSANLGYSTISDIDVWTIGAEYDVDLFELELDITSLGGGADLTSATLTGKYYIQDNIRLLAGLSHYDLSGDRLMGYDLGAGYEISNNVWLDASFGGMYYDGDKYSDILSIGITFETGKRNLRTRENLFDFGKFYQELILIGG